MAFTSTQEQLPAGATSRGSKSAKGTNETRRYCGSEATYRIPEGEPGRRVRSRPRRREDTPQIQRGDGACDGARGIECSACRAGGDCLRNAASYAGCPAAARTGEQSAHCEVAYRGYVLWISVA